MAFQFRTQYGWDEQPTEPNSSTPAGFYPAKVVAAEEKYSKSGKLMLQLSLEVDAGGIKTVDVREYLLLEQSAAWKLEQYLAAIGVQFGSGDNVTIDANTFLGRQLYVLTYNEPGLKNPERLYMKVLKAFRPQDVKQPGPLPANQLEGWGLDTDGTRKADKAQQSQAPVNTWGQQVQASAPTWGQQAVQHTQQNAWTQPGQQVRATPPAQMPHEEDDDILF